MCAFDVYLYRGYSGGRSLLFGTIFAAFTARMVARMEDSLRGGFGPVDGDAVPTAAGFLTAWGMGAAVGHRKMLARW